MIAPCLHGCRSGLSAIDLEAGPGRTEEGPLESPETSGAPFVWSPATDLATLGAWTVQGGDPRPDLAHLNLVAEGPQEVHLLWTSEPWHRSGGPFQILHGIFDGRAWNALPSFEAEQNRVLALKAAPNPAGGFHVLWAEDEGLGRSQVLYVRAWSGRSWTERERASDPGARVFVMGASETDLAVLDGGNTHVFWQDLREENLFQDFMSMGHAGQISKTFHRRRFKDGWTEALKMQKRGACDAREMSAIRDVRGTLHLFWAQRARWSSTRPTGVFHAAWRDGRWSRPERIAPLPDMRYGGPAYVSRMEAAPGADGSVYCAWTWSRSLAKTSELVLEVRRLSGGRWSGGEALARRWVDFAWARGRGGVAGLVVQACGHPFRPAYRGPQDEPQHALYFAPLVGSGFVRPGRIADDAVNNIFAAAMDPEGGLHLAYVVKRPDGSFHLVYRRGDPRPG